MRKVLGYIVLVTGFVNGANVVNAQTNGDVATSHERHIEEIVVTARKRDERISEVPTAITAFGGEDIDKFALDTVDQLANFTPGLIVAESAVSSGGSISLRGVGTGDSNYLADQAVAINVDGMQVGTLNIRKTAQIDLAQIEVLRGPQALFFGKNSPGGVIAFKSADPGSEREIAFSTGYEAESQDAYYQALYSSPITDRVGVRVVGRYTNLNGYYDLKTVPANGDPLVIPPHVDSWPSGEEYFVRGTVLAELSDDFRLKGKVSYNKSDIEGGSITVFQRIDCPQGIPQRQPSFPCKANNDIYIGGGPANAVALVDGAPTLNGLGLREDEQILSTIEMEYDLSDQYTLTAVTGYYDFSEINAHNASVGPRAVVLVPYLPFDMTQWTQELRITSNFSGPFNFMLGGFYETRNTESSQNGVVTIFPPAPFDFGTEALEQDQHAYSFFGNVTWDVSDALELSAGLRYSKEEKDLSFKYNGVDVSANLARDSIEFSNVSPEVTLSYDITDEVMFFASYKEGFKSGGFDGGLTQGAILTPGFSNTFDEENVSGFEAGLKTNFNGTLAINVTAYSYEYDDLQVGSFDAETITFKVRNAAAATIEGLEVDANWLAPIDGLSFRGSIAYNDAKFDEFLSGCYVGQTVAGGCDITFDAARSVFLEQDLSGERLHRAPEYVVTAGAAYERTFSNGAGFDLTLNAFYSDEYSGNLRQSPQDVQDSYTKVNASLRFYSPEDRWEVALTGYNLTNEYTFSRSGAVTLTGGGSGTAAGFLADRSGVVSEGREVQVKLTYRFNGNQY